MRLWRRRKRSAAADAQLAAIHEQLTASNTLTAEDLAFGRSGYQVWLDRAMDAQQRNIPLYVTQVEFNRMTHYLELLWNDAGGPPEDVPVTLFGVPLRVATDTSVLPGAYLKRGAARGVADTPTPEDTK